MAGMPRMTISAPRDVLREFVWLCHRRGRSASEVVREFIGAFVDSRFAEIEARDAAESDLSVYDESVSKTDGELVRVEFTALAAAACGPRGGDP